MIAIEEITRLLARMDSLERDDREAASAILSEACVISKTFFSERSDYSEKLEKIGFSTRKIYSKGHLMSVLAWEGGTRKLRSVLESMRYELSLSKTKAAELAPPEKVTLAWLFNHLSWRVWLTFAGSLGAAFLVGLALGRNDFLMRLFDLVTSHTKP
jgi:hypothetical protein